MPIRSAWTSWFGEFSEKDFLAGHPYCRLIYGLYGRLGGIKGKSETCLWEATTWMIGVSDNLHEQNSLQELLAVLLAVALNA